ncbi:MAG: hypothetical protein N2255_05755, partial [Kiritimatiellae bacterium]|nr:hypothetical protein [Kiritimatiellia bacterium]
INEGPLPPGFRWGHSYDSNTLNPVAREFYATSQLLSYALRRYNLDTKTWETMAQPQSAKFGPGEASGEYFPDRDELVWVQDRALGVWKRAEDKWYRVATLPGLAFRSPVARYIPAHKCIVILGGADTTKTPASFSHAVYKYDSEGKVTQLKDSPASIKVYINRAVIAVDPVTSECLFIQAVLGNDINDFTGKIEFWKYNAGADEWTQLDESVIPQGWWQLSYPFAVVATPIPKYGVIMYMSAAGKNSKVYLYKGGRAKTRSL